MTCRSFPRFLRFLSKMFSGGTLIVISRLWPKESDHARIQHSDKTNTAASSRRQKPKFLFPNNQVQMRKERGAKAKCLSPPKFLTGRIKHTRSPYSCSFSQGCFFD
jgi:hypothetical protein